MAKGKYHYWLTEDGQSLLKDWARNGATDQQIADRMNIHVSTLYDWKNKHPEIAEALKESKEICDGKIENALYNAALGGNITAMIFWLKNRRPDKWRDNPDYDMNKENYDKIKELIDSVPSAIN